MTPSLHNCQKQPPPAGGGALSWPFPGRGTRPACSKGRAVAPRPPHGEPPSWRLRKPHPCRDRFHETPAHAASTHPTHTLYPFACIGERVRGRFVFSHARHPLSAPRVSTCEQQARERNEVMMTDKALQVNDAIAPYTTAYDGYVVAEEVWIKIGKSMDAFRDAVCRINNSGLDVVDEAYEDIYREKKGIDKFDESKDVRQAIIDDLEKAYNEKLQNGQRSILQAAGFSRGVQVATRAVSSAM